MGTGLKTNFIWNHLHAQVTFYGWHHVGNHPSKAAAVICVSFVFYLGQFQPSRRSRAPATSMSVSAAPGIQMRIRLVWEELCDFHLMRLGRAPVRWRPDCVDLLTSHNHQSHENDWSQTSDQSTSALAGSCISLSVQSVSAWRREHRGLCLPTKLSICLICIYV